MVLLCFVRRSWSSGVGLFKVSGILSFNIGNMPRLLGTCDNLDPVFGRCNDVGTNYTHRIAIRIVIHGVLEQFCFFCKNSVFDWWETAVVICVHSHPSQSASSIRPSQMRFLRTT